MQFDNGITRTVLQRSGSIDIEFSPTRSQHYYSSTPRQSRVVRDDYSYHSSAGSLGTTRTSRLSSQEEIEQELRMVEEELLQRRRYQHHSPRAPDMYREMSRTTPAAYDHVFSSETLKRGGLSEDAYSSSYSSNASRYSEKLRRSHHHSPLATHATGGRARKNDQVDISKRIQAFKFRSHGINPTFSPSQQLQELPPSSTNPVHDSGGGFISADGTYGSFDGNNGRRLFQEEDLMTSPSPRQQPPTLVSPPHHRTTTARSSPATRGHASMVKSPLEYLRSSATAGGEPMHNPNDSDDEVVEVSSMSQYVGGDSHQIRDQLLLAKQEEEKFRKELKELEQKMNRAEAARISEIEVTRRERRASSAKLESKTKQVEELEQSISTLKAQVASKEAEIEKLRSEREVNADKLDAVQRENEKIEKKLNAALAKAKSSSRSLPIATSAKDSLTPREILQEGMVFVKHGNSGSPHTRFMCLSQNGEKLLFGTPEATSNKIKSISVSDIVELKKGHRTNVFSRSKRGREHACFSILTNERTLDLELVPFGELTQARRELEERVRDYWFDAINQLIA